MLDAISLVAELLEGSLFKSAGITLHSTRMLLLAVDIVDSFKRQKFLARKAYDIERIQQQNVTMSV
jgi:hypothetical protein